MSQVALIIASVLVLGFAAFAVVYSIHTEATGARRLALVAALAGGCAVGLEGEGEPAALSVVVWTVTALLAALALYAYWRETQLRTD
jgi:hypothetical protein